MAARFYTQLRASAYHQDQEDGCGNYYRLAHRSYLCSLRNMKSSDRLCATPLNLIEVKYPNLDRHGVETRARWSRGYHTGSNVCFGSKADIGARLEHVRFTPNKRTLMTR